MSNQSSDKSPRGSGDRGPARKRKDSESDESGSREIFVSNIPYNVSEAGLTTALKRIFSTSPGFIGIKRISVAKGFATVEFESHAEAVATVESNPEVKLGPRKLFIRVSDPAGAKARRTERDSASDEQRNTQFEQDTTPNPDCWFCLANPNFEKHTIYGVDDETEVYVNLAKGGLRKHHSLICPVTHYGCFAQVTEDVRKICAEYTFRVSNMFEKLNQDVVVFERWVPMSASAANHMQIHIVPVDKDSGIDWRHIMLSRGKSAGIEFVRVSSHEEVVAKMSGILNRVSYLYFSFPGADGRESWLGIGKMNFAFPREIICEGLGCPERVDWKACQQHRDAEVEQVDFLKSQLFSKEVS